MEYTATVLQRSRYQTVWQIRDGGTPVAVWQTIRQVSTFLALDEESGQTVEGATEAEALGALAVYLLHPEATVTMR